jgi:hypothetical protein
MEPEQRLGEAMADAGITVCLGLEDWKAGGALAPATRLRAAEHLGRVALLQLEHLDGDADFGTVARLAAAGALVQALRRFGQRGGARSRAR